MGSSSSYSPLSSGRHRFHRPCTKRCRAACGLISLVSAIAISLTFAVLICYIFITYPAHASCSIQWTFNSNSCSPVADKIDFQIKNWTTNVCKNGDMKCLYKLEFSNESLIEGSHLTPKMHFKDSFNFKLNEINETCLVEGFSSSDLWFALLDFGVNYCNLHNLITGSGLNKMSGYSESTSDAVCTQYSSRNCDVA